MTGDRTPIQPLDLTGREDVREALDLLLARVGAVHTTIERLQHYVDHDLLEAAWELAGHVYGWHPSEGGLGDAVYERVDPIEASERARIVERIAAERAP